MWFNQTILPLLLFAAIHGGCGKAPLDTAIPTPPEIPALTGPDYRDQGRLSYDRVDGTLVSATGCKIAYSFFKPMSGSDAVLVVLGHGFMRNKARMTYLAGHLAGWGIPVVNMTFCNSKPWAGNHDLNGADMVAVAHHCGARRVIYAGFSAGGLAALVAAGTDGKAIAYFGLDAVDHRDLGRQVASDLNLPAYGLAAAPSACNAYSNGLEWFAAAPHSTVVRVMDSSHCHFEFPVDGKCTFVCGRGEKHFSRDVIQQTILGLTTAFMLWQTGIDPHGRTWWSEYQPNHQMLIEAGLINRLVSAE